MRIDSEPCRGSERLGHAKVSMTMETYAHVLPNMQRDAAAMLGTILHGSSLARLSSMVDGDLFPPPQATPRRDQPPCSLDMDSTLRPLPDLAGLDI